MKTVYFAYIEDECEGMFNSKGELLGAWCANDGNWRGEYFDGFLKSVGIKVDYSKSDDPKFKRKLRGAFGE